MADTRRVLSALLTLFADNTAGDISPQDMRDLVVSVVNNRAIRTVTEGFTPGADDDLILADSTAGAITITLPAAASFPRKVYTFRRIAGANDVLISPPGGQEIDAASGRYAPCTVISNGTQWYFVNRSVS